MEGVSPRHLQVLAATDFFTVELWTALGLIRYHVLFVIRVATREVQIAGIVPEPNERWMNQMARNLTDPWEGFLRSSRYLIHDRSTVFTEQFRQTLCQAKVEALRLPARSPNLNAFAERFVRTIREDCLDRLILFGEASLELAVREFVLHYNRERNHQSLDNKIIQPEFPQFPVEGDLRCRKRLGGLLRYYYREALEDANASFWTLRQRIRTFLREYQRPKISGPANWRYFMAFLHANLRLGIFGRERFHYWGLLLWTFFRRPTLFPLAVTLSIHGHHFRKTCRVPGL